MGIEIALIDSGINPRHSHGGGVEGGTAFSVDSDGKVVESDDFMDQVGHGTAIAGIIREAAPAAKLHVLKIFHEDLKASICQLFAAMEWAISRKIKIIHLSLGTEREKDREHLEDLCRHAFDRNILIVAAARKRDDQVFPAVFETTIGVYWNRECDESSLIYHSDGPIEFGAHGGPRPLPGQHRTRNFCGSSFAAARVTARVVRFLEGNPDVGTPAVREMLAHAARNGFR